MSSNVPGQQAGPGLGQSKPLVNIPGASTISRGIAVPVGDDHPLAATSPPPAPLTAPASPPNTQQTPSAMIRTPIKAGGPPPITSPLPSIQASSAAQTKVVSTAVSPSKSLEATADDFLSGPSYRTETLELQPLLRPTPLPRQEGIHRLRTLVERRAWGDVLKIATGILNSPKEPHADVYASLVMLPLNAPQVDVSNIEPHIRAETIEIMTLQCHSWLKLRRYGDLATEVGRWNFLAQNDASANSPEWLPWSLHILAGHTQQYTDETDRSSDELFEMRERIPKEDFLSLVALDSALSNMFLRQSRWQLALGSMDRIIELVPTATKQYVALKYPDVADATSLEAVLMAAFKCEILSRQGRAFLQLGALPQVNIVFESAREQWSAVSASIPAELVNHRVVKTMPMRMEMNDGLYYFAKSNYKHAMESFTRAIDLLRNQGVPSQQYDVEDWMGPTVAGTEAPTVIYTECINNLSLCCLYTCHMKEAVDWLEGLIREDPTAFFTERVAFNLCTLYELRADSATSAKRKRVLQLIAKRFFLHDVGPENFRIN